MERKRKREREKLKGKWHPDLSIARKKGVKGKKKSLSFSHLFEGGGGARGNYYYPHNCRRPQAIGKGGKRGIGGKKKKSLTCFAL